MFNDYLEEAISNKKITLIRNEFSVIAHEDPSFSTGKFDATLEYVKSKKIDGVFDAFDGRVFKSKEEWNEEYWALIVSSLMDNFCEERIDHLKEVSRYLYPSKQASEIRTNINGGRNQKPCKLNRLQDCDGDSLKKAVPAVITAGLAVTCVTAIAAGAKTLAVVSGISALAAGTYTITRK